MENLLQLHYGSCVAIGNVQLKAFVVMMFSNRCARLNFPFPEGHFSFNNKILREDLKQVHFL